jgi:transcriptional regulator with GAF, ATPase, and Fis domain
VLFLDEVGELSPRGQAKLLRVIQEGEIRRIGETVSRRVDVRPSRLRTACSNRRSRRGASGAICGTAST